MPLQSTGPISLADIAAEFSDAPPHSLSEFYGIAAGLPTTGAIGIQSFYGLSAAFQATLTTNQQEFNLRTWLIGQGWDQVKAVVFTIASGVYVWSNNNTVAALNTGGTYPGGLTIINNGFIIGRGGNGGTSTGAALVSPTVGGPAINLTVPVSIDNTNGYIGGGGGGGGYGMTTATNGPGGGGGAGGGLGGVTYSGFTVLIDSAGSVVNPLGGTIGGTAPLPSQYVAPHTTATVTITRNNATAGGPGGLYYAAV
jgi:hypothetical protein